VKNLASGLQAQLSSGVTTVCHCWRVTTRSGNALGFTDHDRALQFDGTTFDPETGFTGTALETALGLSAAGQDVTGALRSDAFSEAELSAGVFDDAAIEIWLVDWNEPENRALLRTGNIGEVARGPLGFTAEVRGLAERLSQPQGRLFQYMCDAELGDERCGVDTANPDYAANGSVISVDGTRRYVVAGIASYASAWFEGGSLEFLSGANAGQRTSVASHSVNAGIVTIEAASAPAYEVVSGDQLRLVAGCDKRFDTCRSKFANAVNFRGFPHMPGNDFITYYPVPGEGGSDA
jgi:uncharacterized phage protein (TIGR02218 family)